MSKEIDDYINEQVAAGRATKQQILEQFAKSDDAELTAYAATANKTKVEETKKTMMELATTPHPTIGVSPLDVALYGGAAALSWQAGKKLADLGIQGMSNLGGQISNTIFGKAGSSAPPPSTSTQDLMATPDVEKTPIANKIAAESEAKFGVPLSDVEKHFDVKITNLKDAEILSNSYKNSLSGAVSNQPAGVPTIQPNVPANPAGAFAQPSGYSQAAPQQTLTHAVETGGDVGHALKTDVAKMVDQAAAVPPPAELRTGTGKPAYAGQGPAAEIRAKGKKAGEPMLRNNYAKVEDVPTGYAFVPGAQHIDTSRTNIGQTEYTKAYTSRPFPASNELAVQESNDINRLLGRPTRAEAKAAGLTLPPQTPGITKHVLESKGTPFMGTKAAKVGGILGALIAIPDLVNAQTVGQRGMAGANLLESVLPLGAQINEAGAPGVQQSQVSQAALLGSPFAQTEWAKTQRLRERAGAGRGIAPPSAYQR